MKTIIRVLALSSLVSVLAGVGNTASATETCGGELRHALPVQMNKGAMVSVSDQVVSNRQGDIYAGHAQQLRAKPNKFDRYQRPVLVDKGICHQKLSAFNKTTIKM